MTIGLKAGGEVISYCTKCKLMLNHRIVAMVGTKPAKVECSTCSSHHNYRASLPGVKAAGTRTTKPRAGKNSAPLRNVESEADRERRWEKAVSGKGVHDFKKFNIQTTFASGDLVHHTKFGDGLVTQVLDPRKIEVLFKDQTRTLAHGVPN